jgi:ribosomal protein L21
MTQFLPLSNSRANGCAASALFVAVVVATIGGACGARAQTFSGTATAVLGSSMTPQETRQLAFEKARQNALQKFGTYVVSEERLARMEIPEGIKEVSTKQIWALAAGETRLVDGSKQVQKTVSGTAIVYQVSADFEIEPTGVENALRAYLERGRDSPLGRSVEDAVRLQKKVTDLEVEGTDAERVRRLLTHTEEAYEQVSAAVEGLDGSSVQSKLAQQRRKRKIALLRYLRKVKGYGHPRDLLRLSVSQAEIQDNGDEVTFTYKARSSITEYAQKVVAACRQTRPTWAPDNSRDNGVIGRPATDGWLKQVFEDSYLDFEVERPLIFYMLDEAGDVLLIIAKTSEGMMSSPSLEFNYGHCEADHLISSRLWSDEWELEVPTEYLSRVESVVLATSTSEYREIAERNGFRAIERGMYERGQGRPVPVRRFVYARKEFTAFVNKYIQKVTSLPLTGYEKETEQSSSIDDFFNH